MPMLVITPNSYQNALDLIDKKADVILVGQKKFSDRMNYDCSLEDLQKIILHKKDSEVWVNVNTFFYEQDLEDLEKYLEALVNLKVDRIIFNDYAVAQIAYERNWNVKLHYNPNTLITSYAQLPFYIDNDFKSVTIANELFLPEVKIIADNKSDEIDLLMQVSGFVFIMHSRWNLVTNFQNYVNDDKNEYTKDKQLFIKEINKVWPNIIIEDDHGTHMFSGYELSLVKYVDQLKKLNIKYWLIDSFMNKDDAYTLNLLNIYQTLLRDDSKKDEIYNEYEQRSKNKLSAGFIGGVNDIKHLQKVHNEKLQKEH